MPSSSALDPIDRRILHKAMADAYMLRKVDRAVGWGAMAIALVLGLQALWLGWPGGQGASGVPAKRLLVQAVMVAVALAFGVAWRRRARRHDLGQALAQAVRRGRKQVLRGPFAGLAVASSHTLVYRVAGQALEVHPLTGPFGQGSNLLPRDSSLMAIEHLADAELELHWVEAGGRKLLLQAHYPGVGATVSQRPATPQDHVRSAAIQPLAWVVGVALLAIVLMRGLAGGWDANLLLVLGVAAATGLSMGAIAWLWLRRQSRRNLGLILTTGPVTERLTVRLRTPRRVVTLYAYRIGGVLVDSPETPRMLPVGQPAQLQTVDHGDGALDRLVGLEPMTRHGHE
jgi:hypothetical protein